MRTSSLSCQSPNLGHGGKRLLRSCFVLCRPNIGSLNLSLYLLFRALFAAASLSSEISSESEWERDFRFLLVLSSSNSCFFFAELAEAERGSSTCCAVGLLGIGVEFFYALPVEAERDRPTGFDSFCALPAEAERVRPKGFEAFCALLCVVTSG